MVSLSLSSQAFQASSFDCLQYQGRHNLGMRLSQRGYPISFTLERHSNARSVCVIIIMEINTADCHWNGDWLIILAILFISLGWVTGWPSPRRGGLWQRMQASRMRTRLTSMTLGTRWTRGGGRRAVRSKDKSMGGIELAPDWFLSQFFSACKVFQSSLSNLFCYSCCKRSLAPHYEPHPL